MGCLVNINIYCYFDGYVVDFKPGSLIRQIYSKNAGPHYSVLNYKKIPILNLGIPSQKKGNLLLYIEWFAITFT